MKLKLHFLLTVVVALLLANAMFAQTTYIVATNGNWSTITWIPAGTPGPTDNVVIDTNTVTADVNFNIKNLTIGNTGKLRINGATSIAMIINGDLTINSGGLFQPVNNTLGGTNGGLSHTIDLKGNITNYGTFTPRTGSATANPKTLNVVNITLSGSSNSTLYTSNNSYPASSNANMFNLLTIDKTGGAKVILTSNWVMSGGSSSANTNTQSGLVLTNGIMETGNYYFANLSTTDTLVRGYSSSSYVVGCLGRGISSSGGGNKKFPVGDANDFELVSVYSTTTGSATGHCVFVRCIPGTPNNTSITGGGIDKVSAVRYYKVSYGNIGAGATTMNFNHFRPSYNYSDGVSVGNTDLRVAYSLDSMTTWKAMGQGVPHTSSLTTVPRQISPDTLGLSIGAGPVITLNAGGTSFFVAIARNTGTTANFLELSSFTKLILTAFLEGCTNSGGTAMKNDIWPTTVSVELHDGSTLALVTQHTGNLSTVGIDTISFTTPVSGTVGFYIVIKSPSTVETWSANPLIFSSSFLTYNFSTSAEQSYGSNMVQKGSTWCIYSGDVSKDATNIVDGSDVIAIDNDNTYGVTDNAVTDITGDGIVDGSDVINVDNNNTYGINRQAPGGAPMAKRVMRPGIIQKQNIK